MNGMQGMNLSNLQALLAAQQQPKKPLVEFRAGMLTQTGTTVTADERRGKVVLTQSEDGLLHLRWRMRPSDSVELDLIIFPKGGKLEKVPECTTGRVFMITLNSARHFFWMQEPKDDKDDEICKQLNDFIDEPPQQGFGGMRGNNIEQLLAGMGGQATPQRPQTSPAGLGSSSTPAAAAPTPATPAAPTAAATPAPATAGAPAGTDNLAATLQAMAAQYQEAQASAPSLEHVLDADRVSEGLSEADIQSLLEHLPEGQRTSHHLDQTLRSPQLQQTLQRLTGILNSSQFGGLMASLSLPATGSIGVAAFIEAIESESKKEDEKKD